MLCSATAPPLVGPFSSIPSPLDREGVLTDPRHSTTTRFVGLGRVTGLRQPTAADFSANIIGNEMDSALVRFAQTHLDVESVRGLAPGTSGSARSSGQ